MFNVITHPAALEELQELPDELRGRMTRLIERLESEGKLKMPHSRVIGAGLFELRVGDKNIARTLYATQSATKSTYCMRLLRRHKKPRQAIEIARKRLKEMS